MIYENILATIGRTPLIRLNKSNTTQAEILLKLEWVNPGGSIKDRTAYYMIKQALSRGDLRPGQPVIEATSGNTGIGLAMVCAVLGHPLTIVMPDNVSQERIHILENFNTTIVLTPAAEGMKACLSKIETLQRINPSLFCPAQFINPDNPLAHASTTGVEIWEDTGGEVDAVVIGMGTGGTISGCAQALKKRNPAIEIIGVEPTESPLLTKGYIGPHRLQGIGMSAGFIPPILARDLIDRVVTANYEQALTTIRQVACNDGIFLGLSSGATLHAALELARHTDYSNRKIVVVLMDNGYRYLTEMSQKIS